MTHRSGSPPGPQCAASQTIRATVASASRNASARRGRRRQMPRRAPRRVLPRSACWSPTCGFERCLQRRRIRRRCDVRHDDIDAQAHRLPEALEPQQLCDGIAALGDAHEHDRPVAGNPARPQHGCAAGAAGERSGGERHAGSATNSGATSAGTACARNPRCRCARTRGLGRPALRTRDRSRRRSHAPRRPRAGPPVTQRPASRTRRWPPPGSKPHADARTEDGIEHGADRIRQRLAQRARVAEAAAPAEEAGAIGLVFDNGDRARATRRRRARPRSRGSSGLRGRRRASITPGDGHHSVCTKSFEKAGCAASAATEPSTNSAYDVTSRSQSASRRCAASAGGRRHRRSG